MRKITVFLLLCCIGWLLSARAADSVKNTNNGVLKQSVYIDFGKNNGLDGNVTEAGSKRALLEQCHRNGIWRNIGTGERNQ